MTVLINYYARLTATALSLLTVAAVAVGLALGGGA